MQSMSQQKETKRQREMQQEASVHDADLMGRFMRLCDAMLVAGLVDLCKHSLQETVTQLQANHKHGIISAFGDLVSVRETIEQGPDEPFVEPKILSCSVMYSPSKGEVQV